MLHRCEQNGRAKRSEKEKKQMHKNIRGCYLQPLLYWCYFIVRLALLDQEA